MQTAYPSLYPSEGTVEAPIPALDPLDPSRALEPAGADIVEALPELYGLGDDEDKKILRRTLAAAALFHVILLVVHLPKLQEREIPPAAVGKAYVVKAVRFKPPVQQRQQQIPKKKAKKIPIPDPTPDEPEPLLLNELDVPEIEIAIDSDVVFGIPNAPPGLVGGGPVGAVQVGGDVLPPKKIHSPQPRYTEEARKARIQGAVILQTVIDALGNVTQVKVLKGLSMGLTESAIKTVRGWHFQPATQNGQPIAVYYNLVVTFNVQ